MAEEWKDIQGFEGYYQISNNGSVKSIERFVKNGNNKVRLQPGAFRKIRINHKGYQVVQLNKEATNKMMFIHRLVAIHFIPNPNNLPEVNHKLGNKEDNRDSMLEWSTKANNIKEAYRLGLKRAYPKFGSDNTFAKLSEDQALEIKDQISLGIPDKEIAISFSVSRPLITMIRLGKRRKKSAL